MLLAGFWIVSSVLASRILVDATFLIGSSTDGRTLFTSPFSRIVEEAIEYGRRRMIQHGPFFLGSSEQEVLGDTNRIGGDAFLEVKPGCHTTPKSILWKHNDLTKLNVKLSNVTLSKAGDFKVVSVENSVLAMWTKIRVNYPNLHVDGNFQIDGAIRGADVNGQGKFSGDFDGLDLSLYAQFRFVMYYLQIRRADLDYIIKNIKFTAKGLSVQGLTDEQAESLLNETLLDLLINNKEFISNSLSQQLMTKVNESIKGKTLLELIAWLKGSEPTTSSTHLVLKN